jgi:chemotaxis protein methyltransferase CheR
MDTKTFDKFRALVYEKSGIAIKPDKVALVTARVGKRMRALSIENHRDYLAHVLNDGSGTEIVCLLDSISTNVTHFFRENDHFDFFERTLKGWMAEGRTRFRFWSAASSSGEEPYSMAMTLCNAAEGGSVDGKILATDLSTKVLEKCVRGIYNEKSVEAVPPHYRKRFFEKAGDAGYRVADVLKRLVTFSRLNLSETPYPMNGPMDAIFCRNVMIYFDNAVRKRLLDECYRLLKAGGYLFVGHAETLTGILSDFKAVAPSIYIKN